MKRRGDAQLSAFAAKKLALEEAAAAAAAIALAANAEEEDLEDIDGESSIGSIERDAASNNSASENDGQEAGADHNRFSTLADSTGKLTVHPSRTASVREAEEHRSLPAVIKQVGDVLHVQLEPNQSISICGRFRLVVGSETTLSFYGGILRPGSQHLVEIPVTESWRITTSSAAQFSMYPCSDGLEHVLSHYSAGRTLYPTAGLSTSLVGHATHQSVKGMDWQPSLNDSVFLAGHKNTGKSTLARHYINASLSSGYRVLYIELDPGQPQFTPPGLLSASVLHPAVPLQLSTAPCSTDLPDLLKSHWIGETSAKEDPDHYYRCALNLLSLINEQPDSIVTIINTPGWIKGTGLELLVSIISASSQQLQCPLHVCHLGLSDLPNQLPANVTLHLTPKTIEPDSHSVSAADARNLNLMTYFHRTGQQSESVWHTGPLVDSPTWVTSFDQDSKAGISGVFILRESLKPLDLIAAINGTIMALVAVEKSILDNVPKERTQHGPPYFMNDGDPLDPSHSECIGLAIIAGLDLAQHKVHLISPVSARQLQSLAETGSSRALVLVSGGIELPAAAYFGNNAIRGERPYVTRKPGEGVGWQAWHVRRNIGRRLRNT